MTCEEIRRLIETGIPGARAEVDGDGTHFTATVVSDGFAGKSMLQQHRIVYQALGQKMGREIHALSLRTLSPDEWDRHRELDPT